MSVVAGAEPRGSARTREAGRTWPTSLRDAAVRLAADDGLSIRETTDRLRLDHGAEVPAATVRNWVREAKRPRPSGDLNADLRSLTQRAIRLCEAEMRAIEDHGRRPIDIDRLAKLTALLRRLKDLADPPKVKKTTGLAKLGQGGTGLEQLLNEVQDEAEAETAKPFGPPASLDGDF